VSAGPAWTRARIEALGPTTDVPHTAKVMGCGASAIYEAIRRGEWKHTRVLRLGRAIRIPTSDLVNLLYPPTPAAPTENSAA
jgi:excisionase family DNA binding protein